MLFPVGTDAFQATFASVIWTSVLPPLLHIVLGRVCLLLNTPSAEYFRRTREAAFGKNLEEIGGEEYWTAAEKGLGGVKRYLEANGDGKNMLMTGDKITYSDFYVTSIFRWMKMIVSEESNDWERLMAMHDGKWERFITQFSEYEFVDA